MCHNGCFDKCSQKLEVAKLTQEGIVGSTLKSTLESIIRKKIKYIFLSIP